MYIDHYLIVLLTIHCWPVFSFLANSDYYNSPILKMIIEKYYTDPTKTINIQSWSNTTTTGYYSQLDMVNEALPYASIPIVCSQNHILDIKSSFYNIYVVDSCHSFHQIYTQLEPSQYDSTGLFTIVYVGRLSDDFSSLRFMLLSMWKKKIINVIAAVAEQTSLEIYSYYPYRPGNCGNIDPIKLASISSTDGSFNDNLFPNHLKNMYGCPLKAGTFIWGPFSILEKNEEGYEIYKGTEVNMVEAVAAFYNFTVKYNLPENGEKWGSISNTSSTGLTGLIHTEVVDLGFGSIGVSVERNLFLKPGVSHSTSTVVFAVPPGRPYTSFEKLYKPFSLHTWTFLAVAFITGLIKAEIFFGDHSIKLLKILKVEKVGTPMLNMWAQALGISISRRPQRNITLAISVGWMIAGLLVRTLHQGVMFKYLQSGQRTKPLQTVEKINAAGLPYYLYDVSRRFFENSPNILKKSIRLAESDNLDEKLHQLANEELNGVLVLPSTLVAYYNYRNFGNGYVNIGSDSVATYNVCIYYPKNSPLPQLFDPVVQILLESGILNYWRARYGETDYDELIIQEHSPITLDSVSAIFVIWMSSLIFCLFVFCIELLHEKCLKDHYKNKKFTVNHSKPEKLKL